jgi:hypothetical protein
MKQMLLLGSLLLAGGVVVGRDDPTADQLHQRFLELRQERDKHQDYGPQAASPPRQLTKEQEERQQFRQREYTRIRGEMLAVALKLAQTEPGSQRSLEMINYRMENGKYGQDEFDLLTRHYATQEHIGYMLVRCERLPHAPGFMRAIIEKNPHMKDRSLARYHLALTQLKTQPEAAVKDFEQLANDLRETTDNDLKFIAGKAAGVVFYHRQLAVGQPVPEVEASDIDGVRFKLNDYRGKVVVLHFWSHSDYGGKWSSEDRDESDFSSDKRALVQRREGQPFVLLGINTDGNRTVAQQQNQKRKVNWRSFWCGPKGHYAALPLQWNYYHGNHFLVIDHMGKIVGRNVGWNEHSLFKFSDNPALTAMLDELVKAASK